MFEYHLAQNHTRLKSLLTAEPASKTAQVIAKSAITKMVMNQKITVLWPEILPRLNDVTANKTKFSQLVELKATPTGS